VASLAEVDDAYDAVVVGAGAGGGVAACVLAEAGLRVLVLERGRLLSFDEIARDHLRNHRLPLRGHSTGPDLDGHPRVLVDASGREHVVAPHEPAWNNNAMCVGGGTRVYGAQCWRFFPEDFRMASLYGRPDGSSLADWPIDYAELAAYYERAEHEIGVSDASGHAPSPPRARGWPLPAAPSNPAREVLARGARTLGWPTGPVPLAVNTVPRDGRAACVRCGTCVGFACPTDAKNGAHNTVLPRALATGRATLVTRAQALRVETDARGRATGLALVATTERGDVQRRVRAGAVVVAAGAIESARLLLASASPSHPAGPGNAGGQLGRHLQGHVYAGAFGEFGDEVQDSRGPGPSIATCRFNHGNPGLVGGGMLANDFVMMPIHYWFAAWPPGLRRFGPDAKRRMAQGYRRTLLVMGPAQEIPAPDTRVELDPRVRDRLGQPVARLSGGVHPETLRTAAFLRACAEEWLRASGAREVRGFVGGAPGVLSAGQHQAGTCRMGDDPALSVTDRLGRVHGCPNLYVADASLHVTNGGVNPVLTVYALAYRVAEQVLAALC
jgi:choline dehydrogenase-like flavoprotein